MIRLFDIFFSLMALIIFLPFLLIIVIILAFTGEREIFYLQNRIGKNEKKIKIIKFATMLKNSSNIGTGTLTTYKDPRVLPFGRFLRKSKINEIPQLINILSGEMSIIGPRPQTKRCFDSYPSLLKKEIIKVKPGLSGIGSIIFRKEDEILRSNDNPDYFYDKVIMPYKGVLEKWFVSNQNIKTYFFLIFLTLWLIPSSKSLIVWKLFKDLPKPPKNLSNLI